MRPILWLASYPKSGNTWLRLLLANLGRTDPVDINAISSDGGIASARARFDQTFLFAAGLLTHDECEALRPALYRAPEPAPMSDEEDDLRHPSLRVLRVLKTHDAWTYTAQGEPVLGDGSLARGAVLVVRDPRDVVASLAHHTGRTLDQAIAFMADEEATFASASSRQPQQLRQRLLGWSGFYRSWQEQREVPVLVLRYEDMLRDTFAALSQVLQFAGIAAAPAEMAAAVRLSAFDQVRAQEEAGGFRESPHQAADHRFFRRGRAGGWREELDPIQRLRVEQDHAEMMGRFGYCPEGA